MVIAWQVGVEVPEMLPNLFSGLIPLSPPSMKEGFVSVMTPKTLTSLLYSINPLQSP